MKWYKKGYNANNATKINNKENVISKKNEITNKSKDKYKLGKFVRYFKIAFIYRFSHPIKAINVV